MMLQAQRPVFLSIGRIGKLDLPAFINVSVSPPTPLPLRIR